MKQKGKRWIQSPASAVCAVYAQTQYLVYLHCHANSRGA